MRPEWASSTDINKTPVSKLVVYRGMINDGVPDGPTHDGNDPRRRMVRPSRFLPTHTDGSAHFTVAIELSDGRFVPL